MLYVNTGREARTLMGQGGEPALAEKVAEAVWIDLLQADESEQALVEQVTGLRVPAITDLSEIESSSRLSTEGGALYLSTPMHYRDPDGMPNTAPLGFVLSDKYLLTVRFTQAPAIDAYAKIFESRDGRPCSVTAFIGLLETIVDRLADVLEHLAAELEAISHRVFRSEGKRAAPSKTDAQLQAMLRSIGRAGERLGNLRDSLLGVQRIVPYAAETASDWIPAAQRPRLKTLRQDIASLSDYDTQLANKVQFLLDATLGFINIEQNNGIKVLTVVSVVGVPPTLVASIYGMNFKWIPELQWEYGYFYGLAVIVASAVVPLIWFKKKGWI